MISVLRSMVVSYWNSTSNHNDPRYSRYDAEVVSYWNSTSNHNSCRISPRLRIVVSYWNSTSNHNCLWFRFFEVWLYLIEILHQTTTILVIADMMPRLYLIEILHQTTTRVVFLPVYVSLYLIEILHQTTTPTCLHPLRSPLYLIEILHQTTTLRDEYGRRICCILLKFYIKPQHWRLRPWCRWVVSYWNSTSNHNAGGAICSISVLYAVLSGREIECRTFVEVSLMRFFVFPRTKTLFFRKIPTAAACPVLPVRSCPRSWECLHTVCLSQTEYS